MSVPAYFADARFRLTREGEPCGYSQISLVLLNHVQKLLTSKEGYEET